MSIEADDDEAAMRAMAKRSTRRLIAVSALAGALTMFVLFVGPCQMMFSSDGYRAVNQRAEIFIDALVDRDAEAAYQTLSPDVRASLSAQRFAELIADERHLDSLSAGEFGSYARSRGDARLTGTVRSDTGDISAVLHLVQIEDQWYVRDIEFAGRPVLSTAAIPGD